MEPLTNPELESRVDAFYVEQDKLALESLNKAFEERARQRAYWEKAAKDAQTALEYAQEQLRKL